LPRHAHPRANSQIRRNPKRSGMPRLPRCKLERGRLASRRGPSLNAPPGRSSVAATLSQVGTTAHNRRKRNRVRGTCYAAWSSTAPCLPAWRDRPRAGSRASCLSPTLPPKPSNVWRPAATTPHARTTSSAPASAGASIPQPSAAGSRRHAMPPGCALCASMPSVTPPGA
jgi:hypothetical protein